MLVHVCPWIIATTAWHVAGSARNAQHYYYAKRAKRATAVYVIYEHCRKRKYTTQHPEHAYNHTTNTLAYVTSHCHPYVT